MKASTLMLLLALPFAACDCSDTAEALKAECHEAEPCTGECVAGTAGRSSGYGMATTRSYCRPRDENICATEPTTAIDGDGQCWEVSTSCLPPDFKAADCDPSAPADEEDADGGLEPDSYETPDWANNGPSGTTCPEGCPGGEACLAGVCVTPCKTDPECAEDEACVLDGATATCVPYIQVCGGGNSHMPDEESCEVDWDACDGTTYTLSCAADGDEQRCTCRADGVDLATFRWHDAVCFCGIEQIVARECGIFVEPLNRDCAMGNYNNLPGD